MVFRSPLVSGLVHAGDLDAYWRCPAMLEIELTESCLDASLTVAEKKVENRTKIARGPRVQMGLFTSSPRSRVQV